MRFRKIYAEISNICNLHCNFCPGTKRKPYMMQEPEFTDLLCRLTGWTEFLYFHLMGEPLCHPMLEKYLDLAGTAGFKVIITTNGTLLAKQQEMLLRSPGLHKLNISLHAFEANDPTISFEDYLRGCFQFGQAATGKKIVCFRLWNQGGADTRNEDILTLLESYFPKPWNENAKGIQLAKGVFLEYGNKFDWPDLQARHLGENVFCYGLRDHIGILCDGTVVPCCLDHNGDIPLGNIFVDSLENILESDRARGIYNGFSEKKAIEQLCQRCGYARRFRRK